MNRTELYEAVTEIFQDVFDDDTLTVTDETSAADIEEWDSLEQINLLFAMEQRFSIKFAVAEVEGLKNVGEMVDLIQSKLA